MLIIIQLVNLEVIKNSTIRNGEKIAYQNNTKTKGLEARYLFKSEIIPHEDCKRNNALKN